MISRKSSSDPGASPLRIASEKSNIFPEDSVSIEFSTSVLLMGRESLTRESFSSEFPIASETVSLVLSLPDSAFL